METLRFTGLHEDGAALVVTAADGTDYLVPIEDRVRSALRQQAARSATAAVAVTPREVQSMIRSGMTPEEISAQTDWDVTRIERYETPIVAERAHVARLARSSLIRTHDRTGALPTLESRAVERLAARGVSLERVSWDSTRPEGGQWTVVITFVAGQRDRHASWRFDPATRSVDALDDEARWLSEDEQSLPRDLGTAAVFGRAHDTPDDLMSSMRERSRKRGRSRRTRPVGASDAAVTAAAAPQIDTADSGGDQGRPDAVPGQESFPEEALPLEDFPYDPDTMGLPPSAHGHVEPDPAGDADHGDDDSDESDESDETTEHEPTLEDFFGTLLDPEQEPDDDGDQPGPEEPDPEPAEDSEPGADGKARKRGRPSVPSWDDIMFGARDRGR